MSAYFPQHSDDPNVVESVSGKTADRFDDNHIHAASFALADQLVEIVLFVHACAGDASSA